MNDVEIRGLVKKYNDITALNNINLNIENGIIYGLLGPNGSGKSTLINILSGVLRFDKGQCTILGKDIRRDNKFIKGNIGVVPQEYAFYDDLKLIENLEFFGRIYGLKGKIISERIDNILEKLDLIEVKNKYPATFSGGMKRRVNIACSIIHNPKILIMDEPTASLDPISREYVLNIVKDINRGGCTIIYTSHYLDEVEILCNKASILNKGVIVAEGSINKISNLFKMRNLINIKLANIDDRILKRLYKINKEILFFNEGNFHIDELHREIHIECINSSKILEKILPFFRENNIYISDINISKATLEEAFIRLINN